MDHIKYSSTEMWDIGAIIIFIRGAIIIFIRGAIIILVCSWDGEANSTEVGYIWIDVVSCMLF